MNGSTVTLPKKVFEDLVRATEYFEQAQNELEDYLLSKNQGFISKAREARKNHKNGLLGDWARLKSKHGL